MRVERLELKNFRGIREMTLEFPGQVTVLAGVNGAGKSSVLDALGTLLTHFAARFRSATGINEKRRFDEPDIFNGESEMANWITLELDGKQHRWGDFKTTRYSECKEEMESSGLWDYAMSHLGSPSLEEFPLAVAYGVNRVVREVPLKVRLDTGLPDVRSAYDGALAGAPSDFASFFEWFRSEEDYENEVKAQLRGNDHGFSFSLEAVRRAVHAFTGFSGLRVQRKPRLQFLVEKGGHTLDIRQMSDGEKCFLSIVGDLARRLAIANPSLENPLSGRGVVLIDEIELHLHPTWQRMVIPKLCEVFPNCQFIVSTHSPQVLGEVAAENIRCLYDEPEKGIQYIIPTRAKGLHSGEILEEIMGAPRQNEGVALRLREIFRLIDREEFEKAKAEINKLREELGGDIPDLVEADSLLFMMSESKAEYNQRGD